MAEFKYVHTFTVEGTGHFPLDMLRRDQCYPRSESDSNRAAQPRILCRVVLERQQADRWWQPTVGRWESFGWKLVGHQRENPRGVVEVLVGEEA